MSDKPTICLDFDGVIHSYERGWTGPEPLDGPVRGSREFVEELLRRGFRVAIVSSRGHTGAGRGFVRTWLRWHKFPTIGDDFDIHTTKVPAILYVDDRGFRFNGSFGEILTMLGPTPDDARRKCLPWNKKERPKLDEESPDA